MVFLTSLESAQATIDLSHFDLSEKQIQIIRKVEARGTVSDEILIKMAKASVAHNLKTKEYIPEHTLQELELLQEWVAGFAFQAFSKEAKLEFDQQAHQDAFPVLREGKPFSALLNMAMAHGMEHFQIDISLTASNVQLALARKSLALSPEEFQEYYLKLLESYGMDHLVSEKKEEHSSDQPRVSAPPHSLNDQTV